MSADGSMAVGMAYTNGSDLNSMRPAIWTYTGGVEQGVVQLLDPSWQFAAGSRFSALSDDGTVGGLAAVMSQNARWTSSGGFTVLPYQDGNGVRGLAGVSGNGTTLVGQNWNGMAVKWTQAGGAQTLGPAGSSGIANAASFDGSIMVGNYKPTSISSTNASIAAMWAPANGTGAPTLLGTLGGSGSEAKSVSSDGTVAVGISRLAGDTTNRAFRWTLETGMENLGALDPGHTLSEAIYVSRNGEYILGRSGTPGGGGLSGFVWSETLGMISALSYLENGNVDLTGWSNLTAFAITDDGTRIAGAGTYNGVGQGFVAQIYSIPLPSGNYWAPSAGGGGNGTWMSGSDVWATSSGVQGTNPQSATDTLIFGDTAGTVTVSGTVSTDAGMQFSTDGYTVTGGTSITLAGANAASNTITTDANVGTTIDSVVAGTNGMTKAGAGTLTLGGANTYSGATEVNAGTLVVDGSANNSSVSVNNGGTLSGSGSVGGIVINFGGTISPGSSGPGELSASGNVEWLGGGNYNWQIYDTTLPAGTGWDLVSATGTVDLSALTVGSEFNINLWSLSGVSPAVSGPAVNFDPNQNYTWTILTAAGGITGYAGTNQFNINLGAFNGTDGFANALAPGWGFSVVKDGNNLNLIYAQQVGPQPVPEPGTWAAGVFLAGGAVFMRWRKRRTKVS